MRLVILFLLLGGCATKPVVIPQPEPVRHDEPRLPVVSGSDLRPGDLLIPDSSTLTESPRLTSSQVRQDLRLLQYAMTEAYGGRKYVKAPAFALAMSRLRDFSKKASALSSLDLLESVDAILYSIPDNHLQMRSPHHGLSQYREEHQRKAQVGSNLGQTKDTCWGVSFRSAGADKKIEVLSLTSFPAPEDPQWSGFKSHVEEILQRGEDFIIDLRGNSGGSDVMAAWLASSVLGHTVSSPFDVVIRSTTPESLILAANNWKFRMLWNRVEHKPSLAYYQTRFDEKMRAVEVGSGGPREERVRMVYDSAGTAEPFAGHVTLVTDAACASSCESLVEFMQQFPRSITVGESTAGSVHFADVGMLLLPASQLMVQIPTDFWRYRDGRYLERIGYAPRVPVAAATDAMDTALGLRW